MAKPRAQAYTLPDGTPYYHDKNNPEPAKNSIKRTGHVVGESFRSYQGKLVSGRVFRDRAGLSYVEFLRMIRRGELVAVARNPANYSLFAEEDIERIVKLQQSSLGIVKRRQGVFEEQCEYTTHEAYEVIDRFKRGLSQQDVFLETKIHPVIIQTILRDWSRMQGGLWLSEEDLATINKLPLEGTFPITTPKELYEVMRLASAERMCGQCNKRPVSGSCLACAKKALYAAKRAQRMRTEGVPLEAEEPTFGAPKEEA